MPSHTWARVAAPPLLHKDKDSFKILQTQAMMLLTQNRHGQHWQFPALGLRARYWLDYPGFIRDLRSPPGVSVFSNWESFQVPLWHSLTFNGCFVKFSDLAKDDQESPRLDCECPDSWCHALSTAPGGFAGTCPELPNQWPQLGSTGTQRKPNEIAMHTSLKVRVDNKSKTSERQGGREEETIFVIEI